MDRVQLEWRAPGDAAPTRLDLPVVVVHMPTPRHARTSSEAPIYEQLVAELGAGEDPHAWAC